MDIDLVFLFIVIFVFVTLLASPMFLSRKKRSEEKNLTPLFQEFCAIRRDSGSGSSLARNMFLWRVSLYPEFMVLALFSQDLIPYREIDRVELKSYQDSTEVWIYRHVEQVVEFITVRSKNAEKIIEIFAGLGVRSDASRPLAGQQF